MRETEQQRERACVARAVAPFAWTAGASWEPVRTNTCLRSRPVRPPVPTWLLVAKSGARWAERDRFVPSQTEERAAELPALAQIAARGPVRPTCPRLERAARQA